MTATNHMLAGAAIATSVQQPLLIIPLAFTSHFLIDMLPHFGVPDHDLSERNAHPLFRYILLIDIALTLALLAALPFALKEGVSWWVLLLGMVAAWIPDLVWIRQLWRHRQGKKHNPSLLTRFHQRIQYERPAGIILEILWFFGIGVLLGILAV